jgi:hypothetical protein
MQGRVGVTSQDLGGEEQEQESEEPESKVQGGAEGKHGAELENGDKNVDVEGQNDGDD